MVSFTFKNERSWQQIQMEQYICKPGVFFLFFLKNTKKGENSNVCLCTQLLPQLFSLIDQQYGAQWAGSKRELKLATSGLCSCPLPTWGSNFSHHWVGGSNPLCFTTVKSLLSVFAVCFKTTTWMKGIFQKIWGQTWSELARYLTVPVPLFLCTCSAEGWQDS